MVTGCTSAPSIVRSERVQRTLPGLLRVLSGSTSGHTAGPAGPRGQWGWRALTALSGPLRALRGNGLILSGQSGLSTSPHATYSAETGQSGKMGRKCRMRRPGLMRSDTPKSLRTHERALLSVLGRLRGPRALERLSGPSKNGTLPAVSAHCNRCATRIGYMRLRLNGLARSVRHGRCIGYSMVRATRS